MIQTLSKDSATKLEKGLLQTAKITPKSLTVNDVQLAYRVSRNNPKDINYWLFDFVYSAYIKNYGYPYHFKDVRYVESLFKKEREGTLKYDDFDYEKMKNIPIDLQMFFEKEYKKQLINKSEKPIPEKPKPKKVIESHQEGYRTVQVKQYTRFHPQSGKYITVKSHKRKIKNIIPKVVLNAIEKNQLQHLVDKYSIKNKDIIDLQKKENDWSHQSTKYPNIIGLTDKEIDDFINEQPLDKQEYIRKYINKMSVLNDDDIEQVCKDMYKRFDKYMDGQQDYLKQTNQDEYSKAKTIFLTSPKGGFEILARFCYANHNHINKNNVPFDLSVQEYGDKLPQAKALPYGSKTHEVNDIVFIDDIFMSGDQGSSAYQTIDNLIHELGVVKQERPRIHYLPIIRNTHTSIDAYPNLSKYYSIISGIDYNIQSSINKSDVSAVVFPYSIPDGSRHYYARKLYKQYKKFPHRKL